jgi:small subunit ribosomal protein S17
MQGKVVSSKMNKTIIVEVGRLIVHPVYKKRVKRTSRFAVHSEQPIKVGEVVEIIETKPYSKTKKFKVTRVLSEEEKKKAK